MVKEFFFPEEAVEKILDDNIRTVVVIGGPDTGKSTLVKELVKSFVPKRKTAILDLDPGQSHVGPPTTVAWAKVENEFKGWDDLKMQDFYFVGDISPRGNLLPLTVGARLMWDKASSTSERIIVDTTGLIRGAIGKVLKLHLVDILRPEVVLALYKEDELDHILAPLRNVKLPRVFKVAVSSNVKNKDFSQRRSYRELRFKDYFKGAKEVEFLLKDLGLDKTFLWDPTFLIVSLRDKNNQDVALGIIKNWSRDKETINVYSPVSNPEIIRRIVLGKLKLTPEGVQIGTERFR